MRDDCITIALELSEVRVMRVEETAREITVETNAEGPGRFAPVVGSRRPRCIAPVSSARGPEASRGPREALGGPHPGARREFSLKKGQVYDTTVGDLEQRQLIGVVSGHRLCQGG